VPWIRCTCRKPLGHIWERYESMVANGMSADEAFRRLGVKLSCCKRTLIGEIRYSIPTIDDELAERLNNLGMGDVGRTVMHDITGAMEGSEKLPSGHSTTVIRNAPPSVRAVKAAPIPTATVATEATTAPVLGPLYRPNIRKQPVQPALANPPEIKLIKPMVPVQVAQPATPTPVPIPIRIQPVVTAPSIKPISPAVPIPTVIPTLSQVRPIKPLTPVLQPVLPPPVIQPVTPVVPQPPAQPAIGPVLIPPAQNANPVRMVSVGSGYSVPVLGVRIHSAR